MEVFVKVAQLGSFSAAASQLGMAKSTVSKNVVALEERLGVRLINRTTRRLSLTEVGQAYRDCCLKIVQEIEEAELSAVGLNAEPRGILKVSAPMTFGARYLSPLVPKFIARWPKIAVDLSLSDRVVDILDEGFDMALRIADLEDSSLIARRLAASRLITVASPDYLRQRGSPDQPEQLVGHNCLTYAYGRTPGLWRYERGGEPVIIRVEGNFHVNNGDALAAAAIEGLGIAMLPSFIIVDEVRSGRLKPLLDDFDAGTTPISVVYPHNRHVSAKLRSFVDFLAESFGRHVPWADLDKRSIEAEV